MSDTVRLVGLIARREILVRVRDRAFLLSAAFLLLVVGLSVAAPVFLESRGTTYVVGTVGDEATSLARSADRLAGHTDDLPSADVEARRQVDQAAARAAVRDGSLDAALLPTADGRLELWGLQDVPEDLQTLVGRAASAQALDRAISSVGADPAVVAKASADAVPATRLLAPPDHDPVVATILSVVFAMLFFFTTFMFGMQIAQSVVEEKQSRIVEIVLAAVPLRALLAGKVLGAAALALAQVAVLLGLGVAGAAIAGQGDVVRLLVSSSGWFLVFFVLGFIALACLWAATGALAARQEDLQATTVPVQALLFLPFFAAVYVTTPGLTLTVLSYVPFTSPLAMPRRLMIGDASPWEASLAAVVLLATALVLIAVGRRLYERSVLHVSGRSRWAEAWRRRPDRAGAAA